MYRTSVYWGFTTNKYPDRPFTSPLHLSITSRGRHDIITFILRIRNLMSQGFALLKHSTGFGTTLNNLAIIMYVCTM